MILKPSGRVEEPERVAPFWTEMLVEVQVAKVDAELDRKGLKKFGSVVARHAEVFLESGIEGDFCRARSGALDDEGTNALFEVFLLHVVRKGRRA